MTIYVCDRCAADSMCRGDITVLRFGNPGDERDEIEAPVSNIDLCKSCRAQVMNFIQQKVEKKT